MEVRGVETLGMVDQGHGKDGLIARPEAEKGQGRRRVNPAHDVVA